MSQKLWFFKVTKNARKQMVFWNKIDQNLRKSRNMMITLVIIPIVSNCYQKLRSYFVISHRLHVKAQAVK